MKAFNEYTARTVSIDFQVGGVPYLPTTVEYLVQNLSSCSTLVDWTSVTPAASVEIDISAQLMVGTTDRRYEQIELTVAADRGTADQITKSLRWQLKNLKAFDS